MDAICRVACRDTGKTRGSLFTGETERLIIGVDAVLGEIMTTMEKIDWCVEIDTLEGEADSRLLKYGEKTLAPSSRSSPLLLAHKVSKVAHPVPFLSSITNATGPLRTSGSSRCPSLVELFFP
jgi:hypothetical protein